MERDTATHCSISYRENINASYTFYGKPAQVTDKAEQLILMAIINGTSLIYHIIQYYTIIQHSNGETSLISKHSNMNACKHIGMYLTC